MSSSAKVEVMVNIFVCMNFAEAKKMGKKQKLVHRGQKIFLGGLISLNFRLH